MANLTISVDEDLLRDARVRAVKEGTSVNRILRQHLERYARGTLDGREATDKLLTLARRSKAASGGRRWTRDELHERG